MFNYTPNLFNKKTKTVQTVHRPSDRASSCLWEEGAFFWGGGGVVCTYVGDTE
jgi:hypothetical protein